MRRQIFAESRGIMNILKGDQVMNKYAFIQNVPGLSVQPYELSFDDGEWLSHVAGFDGIDKCMDYAKKLIADGYSMINFCGDFGPEQIAELKKDAPEGTEIRFAAYLPEEEDKLNALDQYIQYGQIIFGGVDEPKRFDLDAPEMVTHTVFIKDLDQAVETAKKLAAEGMDGIELCGSFDLDMTKAVIAAVESVNPKIPVGSNGIDV